MMRLKLAVIVVVVVVVCPVRSNDHCT